MSRIARQTKRARPTLPPVRSKHQLLEECIERGLRGFLWNDLPAQGITDETIDAAVDRALRRITLEIDGMFA